MEEQEGKREKERARYERDRAGGNKRRRHLHISSTMASKRQGKRTGFLKTHNEGRREHKDEGSIGGS
jgi:hypothetical protein